MTSPRYYEDSDSCSAHPPRRSPHLLRHTFLSFRLQPRRLPGHRLPPRQRDQRVSDFAMNEQARRSSPPNRVRHPTDRPFASGCSPPRLAATQLPSATELWHTPTRSFTVLMWRPHGRTIPACAGMTEPRRLFVVHIIPSHVFSKEDTKSPKFGILIIRTLSVLRALVVKTLSQPS